MDDKFTKQFLEDCWRTMYIFMTKYLNIKYNKELFMKLMSLVFKMLSQWIHYASKREASEISSNCLDHSQLLLSGNPEYLK